MSKYCLPGCQGGSGKADKSFVFCKNDRNINDRNINELHSTQLNLIVLFGAVVLWNLWGEDWIMRKKFFYLSLMLNISHTKKHVTCFRFFSEHKTYLTSFILFMVHIQKRVQHVLHLWRSAVKILLITLLTMQPKVIY